MQNPFEALEGRRLLSGGHMTSHMNHGHHHGQAVFSSLKNGRLNVLGTRFADNVSIAVDATDATKLDVTMNGKLVQYDLADVTRILVVAGKGDDVVTVDPSVSANAKLIGNSGDDALTGGSGNDVVLGGGGNDSCSGGAGDDVLDGGEGTDSVVGGTGADKFGSDDADAEKPDFNAGEGDASDPLDDDGNTAALP